jgi:diacylglycerol kinase (ATP)
VTGEIAMLTNPTSGKGRGAKARGAVLERLRGAGLTVRDLSGRDADEALDLARQAVHDGVDALVVVGGDGIVHLGAQAVAETSTALGIIPAGSGNDVARYFDLPRKDPVAAAERLLAGSPRTVDLARSGTKHFVTVLAAGFDAIVNERANRMRWPSGPRRYDLAILAELAKLKPGRLTVEDDSGRSELDATQIAVGNIPYYGGGIPVCPAADPADGLFDVTLLRRASRFDLVKLLPGLRTGNHVTSPLVTTSRTKKIRLGEANGWVAYADGERVGPLPVEVTCVPNALKVVGPTT